MGSESDRDVIRPSENLPRPGRWVFVMTKSYRCMGYVDETGVWRDVTRKQTIEDVQGWMAATEEETVQWSKGEVE